MRIEKVICDKCGKEIQNPSKHQIVLTIDKRWDGVGYDDDRNEERDFCYDCLIQRVNNYFNSLPMDDNAKTAKLTFLQLIGNS